MLQVPASALHEDAAVSTACSYGLQVAPGMPLLGSLQAWPPGQGPLVRLTALHVDQVGHVREGHTDLQAGLESPTCQSGMRAEAKRAPSTPIAGREGAAERRLLTALRAGAGPGETRTQACQPLLGCLQALPQERQALGASAVWPGAPSVGSSQQESLLLLAEGPHCWPQVH